MNILDYLDTEEFRNIIKENVLEYQIINGVKTVPNNFISKIQSTDPMEIIKNIIPENDAELKESTAVFLLNIHIKRVIEEEIAKINMDVTSELNQYITIVESFGFKKVYEKEYELKDDGYFSDKSDDELNKTFKRLYPLGKITNIEKIENGYKLDFIKNEKEFIYFNEKYGILLHLDSYNGIKINSANIYYQGVIKSLNDYSNSITGNRSYVQYSDTQNLSVDVRQFLSKTIEDVIKYVDLKNKWINMPVRFYSYLSHKKNEKSWDYIELEKIKEMPEEIQKKLLDDNLLYSNDLLEKYTKEKGWNNNYFEFKNFLNLLNENEIKSLLVKNYLLDARYSENYIYLIDDKLKLKAIEEGFNIKNLNNYCYTMMEIIKEKVSKSYNPSNDFELIRKTLKDFNDLEFEASKKSMFNNYNEKLKSIFEEVLHEKLKHKSINKNKLH